MPRYTVGNTRGMKVEVLLDGARVERAVEADTDEGYVLQHRLNAAGRPVIENGEWAFEKIEGHVEVNILAPRDGRAEPKLSPPQGRSGRFITVHLNHDDYRAFYDLVMARGVSGAETIRQLIREAGRAADAL